jgi:hypothetical protein
MDVFGREKLWSGRLDSAFIVSEPRAVATGSSAEIGFN